DVLRVLDMLFKKLTYDPVVEEICLEALKDNNYNIKVAAINVLVRSNNEEVVRRLNAMSDDPQQEVRNALQNKKEPILGMDPDTLSKFIADDAFRAKMMKQLEQQRQQQKLDKPSTEKSSGVIDRISRLFGKK
ncbi:MAG: HEAT repeat domain-containing protein, partial [Bacteroidota bacterium]